MTTQAIQSYTQQIERALNLARNVQILRNGDTPEFVALSHVTYTSMIELLEDLEDALLLEEARNDDDGNHVSLEDARKILDAR